MRPLSLRQRKRSTRDAAPRMEPLEDRRLLSTTPVPFAEPGAIGRLLTPAEVAMIPGGSVAVGPQATGTAAAAPYTPAQIRHAYGVDQLSYDGTGQTIAIIDAYDDPTIATDLASFDSEFGLPTANFTKYTPEGTPASNSGWSLEISLDVEWAHVIAPGAKIALVEAVSNSDTDLFDAAQFATTNPAGPMAKQVSMSFGGGEYSDQTQYDPIFDDPGVSFFASTGDSAGDVLYPATSPYVTSVGGTTISLDSAGDKLSESAWSDGGGGTSTVYDQPSFQSPFVTSAKRTTPDVSYNADPNSGIYVLDNSQYYQVGGTSAGSPQWAGLAALANQGLVAASKPTLGTGQAYGTNSVLYNLAGGSSGYTNPHGDFFDVTSGSNGHPATTGYDLATGLGSPVANKLIPDLIGGGQSATPTVGDSGFEAVKVGSSYAYDPSGSAWKFSGDAGVTGNKSAFTSGNPAAPQGSQVAFLQRTGSFSQSVSGWAAGSYTISFDAAQRGNYGKSAEDFEVLVDGQVVGTFKPSGTSYAAYATASFTVSAGSHVVEFLGLDSAGGDNTALIDAVAVASATTNSAPTVPMPGDPGFEAVTVGGGYAYDPSGSAWKFSGDAGVSGNKSAFTSGNPAAPQGSQVAFLQQTGSFSQFVSGWAAGSYTISFDAAQRGNYGKAAEDFEVLVDGQVVGTFKPSGTSYASYTTSAFTVSAGSHVVEFLGLDSAGGDNTAFIDAVAVASATANG